VAVRPALFHFQRTTQQRVQCLKVVQQIAASAVDSFHTTCRFKARYPKKDQTKTYDVTKKSSRLCSRCSAAVNSIEKKIKSCLANSFENCLPIWALPPLASNVMSSSFAAASRKISISSIYNIKKCTFPSRAYVYLAQSVACVVFPAPPNLRLD
jgi:hypothetical protein